MCGWQITMEEKKGAKELDQGEFAFNNQVTKSK